MSRSFPTSRTRRRGQALLLAVLIMIFAALLSASFLVVVSVNLNQTARQTDKNRSRVAADAGLAHVKQQIAYSAEGDKWRTELENVPPAPGDVDFAAYYTPLDMAQGWARDIPHPTGLAGDLNGNGKYYDGSNRNTIDPGDEKIALANARTTGKLELVKSPDPRSFGNQASESPTYLSQVEQVPNSAGYDLAGALKITVIGLSTEDPTAYTRTVAYIGGNNDTPMARTMWTVGNYDFKNNVVPVAQAGAYDTTNNQLTLSNISGNFPDVPFTVMIGDPQTAVGLRGATVTARAGNVLTLAQPVAPAIQVDNPTLNITGERVGLAANLGAPATIDINNDGAATEPVDFKTSDPAPTPTPTPGPTPAVPSPTAVPTPRAGGIRANGSLWLQGNVSADAMGGTQNAYTPANPVPASIRASNFIAFTAPAPAATPAPVLISGPVFANATPVPIVDSFNPNFPGAGPTWPTSTQIKDSVISDGMNRLKGVPSTNNSTRSVSDFRPPDIGSGLGADRYRNIARSSDIAAGYMGSLGALYGYGQGIYIDNLQDRERVLVSAGPPATYRDMTQTELVSMWLSRFPSSITTPPDYSRTGVALTAALPGSLEQKHLRGWVGPDEFRARGVEVVLGNDTTVAQNPIITITRDSRDDATPLGASPNTTWKDPTGMPLQGVYTKILPWPTTGIFFAEGNVRIRGNALNVPNSLTVVSMGNIYIEDSISTDADVDGDINTPPAAPRRILLMAKKNVVMNPTRVMGRPDAQTLTPATSSQTLTAGTATTLNVLDAAAFRKGDLVQTSTVLAGAETITTQGYVSVDPATPFQQISLTPTVSGTVTGGSLVRTPTGATQLVTTAIAGRTVPANTLTSGFDVLQRRFVLPSPLTVAAMQNFRLAFNHQADRVPAFNVAIKEAMAGTTKPTDGVFFSNKAVPVTPPAMAVPYFDVNAAVIAQGDKKLRGQFMQPAMGNDDFPGTAPTTEVEAMDITRNLVSISTQMNSNSHIDPNTMAMPRVGWQYDTSATAAFQNLPFFYLAGVGNRYDFGVPPTGDTRKNINSNSPAPVTPLPYPVPLANSIALALNGNAATVYDEHFNINLTTKNYDQTKQFGFSPTFLDAAMPPIIPTEDVLTSDQGFYQTDGFQSTLDSRSNYDVTTMTTALLPGSNSLVMRQSDSLVQPVAPATFPTYRLMDAKLENVALAADAGTGIVTTTSISSAYTFNVNAYVYAQTGSWFVIPGPTFDDRLKTTTAGAVTTTYLDLNANNVADAGEFLVDTMSGNGYPDLNRNGTIEETEKHAFDRYSRFNYEIDFNGAIAENQTAIVNTVYNPLVPTQILQPGAVDDWMNKWLTTKYTASAPVVTNDRIHYVFDPTVALNNFNVQDEGFKLPQTTEVFYQD